MTYFEKCVQCDNCTTPMRCEYDNQCLAECKLQDLTYKYLTRDEVSSIYDYLSNQYIDYANPAYHVMKKIREILMETL